MGIAPYGWETPWSSVGGDAHIALINNIDTKHENAHVDKYVIMPNHIYMIIALKNGAMWASPPTDGMAGTAPRTDGKPRGPP